MFMTRLNGWLRAVIVFSAFWLAIILGLVGYEYFTTGPWDYFGDNKGLIFFSWVKNQSYNKSPIEGFDDLSLVLRTQRFWTTLLLPIIVAWVLAGALVPALRWVRRGFHT